MVAQMHRFQDPEAMKATSTLRATGLPGLLGVRWHLAEGSQNVPFCDCYHDRSSWWLFLVLSTKKGRGHVLFAERFARHIPCGH